MRLRRAVWAIGLPEAEMDPPTCSSQPDGKGYAADGHIVAAISGAGPASVTLRLDLPIRCLLAVPSRPCGPDHGEGKAPKLASRSEEHTSELQSIMRISYAVFCLKKKKKNNTSQTIRH